MNTHVHVMMHQDVAVGHDFAADGGGMFESTAHLEWPLHDMGLGVADASMAGAVNHGTPRATAVRGTTAAFGTSAYAADQWKGDQQRQHAANESEHSFPSEDGLGEVSVRVHFSSLV
jgi:hypothetical protein